jgi:type III restriction enzyme
MLEDRGTEHTVGLSADQREVIQRHTFAREARSGSPVDHVFVARQLADIIPNPWIAHEIGKEAFDRLIASFGREIVESNVVHVIEQLRRRAQDERDRLAETVFRELLAQKHLRFLLLKEDLGFRLPSKRQVPATSHRLNKEDGEPLNKSLLNFEAAEDFNEDEKTVAWCLEDQERLLFWYRNIARQDYNIQGWRRHRVYADFIASRVDPLDGTEYDRVFVVETKGLHLKGNPDTSYKEALFHLCNEMAEPRSWAELGLEFPQKKVVFQVVYTDEWRERINALFATA